MHNILIIIDHALYGIEKVYNALRIAMTLQKSETKVAVKIYLLADGVF